MTIRTTTCIIPAKGTSRRIPNKNCQLCAGKPLVCWAYEIAQQAGVFDNIVISTESERVLECVWAMGYQETYRRPPELASDASPVIESIRHCLDWLKERDRQTDYVALIHPTSPCLIPSTVQAIVLTILAAGHDFAITASDAKIPLNITFETMRELCGKIAGGKELTHTTDYPTLFKLNNGLVIGKWDIMYRGDWYNPALKSCFYAISPTEGVDIDDGDDLIFAEAILEWRQRNEVS